MTLKESKELLTSKITDAGVTAVIADHFNKAANPYTTDNYDFEFVRGALYALCGAGIITGNQMEQAVDAILNASFEEQAANMAGIIADPFNLDDYWNACEDLCRMAGLQDLYDSALDRDKADRILHQAAAILNVTID